MTSHNHQTCSLILLLLLVLVCLSHFVCHVGAQSEAPPPPDAYPYADFNPSIITIIVILVAALFLMGFFSIYIRRRSNEAGGSIRAAVSMRRRAAAASRGLDSTVIETFPTFVYSSVKGLKIGKGALECAVCLNEYEDEETLRLIPKCDHVFHPECIDAWFENHVTCPVCRANLVPDSGEQTGVDRGDLDLELGNEPVTNPGSGAVSMEDPVHALQTDMQTDSLNRDQSVKQPWPVFPRLFNKFRSHSTGHSLVQPGENLDRYTLRLPEDVRKQVVGRALLNRTASTVRMAGEGSGRRGYRAGGAISGRRRSYKRMGSLDRVVVRSERWVMSRAPSFLTRAFSTKSPRVVSGIGEASTSATTPKGSKMGDKIPLNNIGPKSC